MARNNNNRIEVRGSEQFLDQLKNEVARELGIPDYEGMDKGWLPSRVNGKVGGTMVRKMIAYAEAAMKDGAYQAVASQRGANKEDKQTVSDGLKAAEMFFDYNNGQIETSIQQSEIH